MPSGDAERSYRPPDEPRNFRHGAAERCGCSLVGVRKGESTMADQDTNLPEGTDEIIPGAMETDTSCETRRSRAGSRSRQSTGTGGALMQKVRSGSDKLSVQAADRARG